MSTRIRRSEFHKLKQGVYCTHCGLIPDDSRHLRNCAFYTTAAQRRERDAREHAEWHKRTWGERA